MAAAVLDVVEALVREYLVKAGCSATLDAYNREKPKHANSITKREVLRKALGLDKAALLWKKQNPGAEGLPSTLEFWVNYQIARVSGADPPPPASPHTSSSGAAPAAAMSTAPTRPAARPAAPRAADDPDDTSAPVGPRRPGSTSRAPPAAAPPSAPPTRPAARQGFADAPAPSRTPAPAGMAQRPGARGRPADDDDDDEEPEIIRPAAPGHAPPGRGPASASHAPRSGSLGSLSTASSPPPASAPSAHPRSHSHSASGSPAPSAHGGRPTGPGGPAPGGPSSALRPAAAPPGAAAGPRGASGSGARPGAAVATAAATAAAVASRPSSHASSAAHHGELVMEEVGDESFGDDADGPLPVAVAAMRLGAAPALLRSQGAAISPDAMRLVRSVLWGGQGKPPPSWKQGFFFCRRPGLGFGLVQRQGGPCGVLAGVQAHVLAALYTPPGAPGAKAAASGFNLSPSPQEQQLALAVAIGESLWQARQGSGAVLVLPEGEAGTSAGKLGYDQLSRAVAQHAASSREAMVELVRAALPVLMAEDGWGVVLFVLSLAFTRGAAAIKSDMDEPDNALMGMHGYCTQDLVNLILLGAATSNVFDGNRQVDSATFKGVQRRSRIGLLTLFEWYKYVEVGPSLKNPALPVWVVCSESHFTVLFAQDGKPLANTLPFDLFYYDELANQDALIKLSVAKDPKGGWTARVGSSIGDRGKCEGQNIPPLECVIETRWPGVKVNWNGHDPIL